MDADISGVNLNLLVAFDALMRERSVTRAARRAGVTQPAMSNALAQLRAVLADPLFVRTGRGIRPTARAEEIAPLVHDGLALLSRALGAPAFDPATTTRRFRVAGSDFAQLVLLPGLLARLTAVAPSARVEVVPWAPHRLPDELGNGVDLHVGFVERLPSTARSVVGFEDHYVCIVRRGHPALRDGQLPLDAWLGLGHVLVTQEADGMGSVDGVLAARGLRRTIAVRVPHFLLVPPLVAATDLVAAVDSRVARPFVTHGMVEAADPPLPLPGGKVRISWDTRQDADPGHAWLREQVRDVLASA